MSDTTAANNGQEPDAHPASITQVVRSVADELAAEGTPLPVPPDNDDAAIDEHFWKQVEERLTTRERLDRGPTRG